MELRLAEEEATAKSRSREGKREENAIVATDEHGWPRIIVVSCFWILAKTLTSDPARDKQHATRNTQRTTYTNTQTTRLSVFICVHLWQHFFSFASSFAPSRLRGRLSIAVAAILLTLSAARGANPVDKSDP